MHRKLHLNMGKNFFTVTLTTHWNRSPREAVESPLLEILKHHLDTILCHVIWGGPVWVGRLDQKTHYGPFQSDLFHDSLFWRSKETLYFTWFSFTWKQTCLVISLWISAKHISCVGETAMSYQNLSCQTSNCDIILQVGKEKQTPSREGPCCVNLSSLQSISQIWS